MNVPFSQLQVQSLAQARVHRRTARDSLTNDRNYEPDKSVEDAKDPKDAKETTNTFLPNINGG